eukprot:1155815-Pelagomonas_calceolata.AAC.7
MAHEVNEADLVVQLAPREPWEEAEEDATDPLGGGRKLPTVITRYTASGGEGASVQDPGVDVLHGAFGRVPQWQCPGIVPQKHFEGAFKMPTNAHV